MTNVSPPQPGRTYPRRILAADDDPVIREFLKLYLAIDGVEVETVSDGEVAIPKLGDGYDLLVLDLDMPGKNGFDVLRALAASPPARPLPVVVLTSRTDAGAIADAFELGASAYVLKPISRDTLIAKVSSVYIGARL
jgi:CheY-like chemotaxis protein